MDTYEMNERKRTKALRVVADHAEKLHAVAKKDAYVGAILHALHSYLRLWRLCTDQRCQRGRVCRGDELRCAAQRAQVALFALREAVDTGTAGNEGPDRRAAADQHVTNWVEEDGVPVIVQRVEFCWDDSPGQADMAEASK
jgi:hypothetical protein